MIQVSNLVKRYAGVRAVSDISFNVDKGEIVGFLGPNGAGKSTTMKILTGYLAPTSGQVKINDLDVVEDPVTVRHKIGYMPENVPLYPEMRIREYMEYRAALKGLKGKLIRSRVDEVMQRCEIADVQRKIIGTLSKGYRQRVGLADALVNDPQLLILDEPTAGLDPNQIRTVRDLIKDLGKEHTILLSTHILSEVEMICNRAIIINRGKIEASDTIGNLKQKVHGGALTIQIRAQVEDAIGKLSQVSHMKNVEVIDSSDGWVVLECQSSPGEDIRDGVDALIKRENWALREFRRSRATLEDVFVELTQE